MRCSAQYGAFYSMCDSFRCRRNLKQHIHLDLHVLISGNLVGTDQAKGLGLSGSKIIDGADCGTQDVA
jgi:hypothetical protein